MNALEAALYPYRYNALRQFGAPAPANALNTRLLDEGTISAGSWLDMNPGANAMVAGLSEMAGIAPSARVMDRVNALRSTLLRPRSGEMRSAFVDLPIAGKIDFGFNVPAWFDDAAGLTSDLAQTALAAADLAAATPGMVRGYTNAMQGLGQSGVIVPRGVNIKKGENFFSLWGKEQPKRIEFDAVDRLPLLRENVVLGKGIKNILYGTKLEPGVAQIFEKYGKNPAHQETAALYEAGRINLNQAEDLFRASINRDEAGKSVFDQTLDLEVRRRAESFNKPDWEPYAETTQNVGKMSGSNRKVGEELIDMDTSRGCIGMCPECYAAYGGSQQSKTCFMSPQPVRLMGRFEDNPEAIRRIGTSGEPNMHPLRWKEIEPEFQARLKDPRPLTADELDQFIDRSYDWSYTNEELKRTGLDSKGQRIGNKYKPGGADQTFVITKLQSLENFDPDVVHNLEVSIDPMMPSHAFKALRNIETLKQAYPNINIMLRIRSVATASDEINTLQKIAVDFANKNNLPVLETRVRFKKSDTAALSQVLPEYYHEGGQYKHISYYPTQKPKLDTGTPVEGYNVRSFDIHGEEGPIPTQVYIRAKTSAYKDLSKSQKEKAPIWEVWDGGKRVKAGMNVGDATELGQKIAQATNLDKVPSKIKVREYALEESPLSQFGLNPNLHKQCNTFNMGAGACGECQACRAWLAEEKLRSYTAVGKK